MDQRICLLPIGVIVPHVIIMALLLVPSPEIDVIIGEICAQNALVIATEGKKLL
jgi:hypothetical protein